MPAPKTYTKAQWDEFARLLDALPEKPPSERRVTVREAMPNVRAHIDAARAKGYSVEQLIGQAKQAGIDVTASALRYALQEAKKQGTGVRRRNVISRSPAGTKESRNQSINRTVRQQSSSVSERKAERKHGEPGSMVIQDTFSFPIRPDVEDI